MFAQRHQQTTGALDQQQLTLTGQRLNPVDNRWQSDHGTDTPCSLERRYGLIEIVGIDLAE